MPFHQCRRGRCCCVQVLTGGAGSHSVVSGGADVVVGRADDGVVVRAGAVDDGVVVDGRVVAGALPPLPVARMIRP